MSKAAVNRHRQIGLDRVLRLAWLDKTARLVWAGNSAQETRTILQDELRDFFPLSNPEIRGSLAKTITILLKIWSQPPNELSSLHSEGLKLLAELPDDSRIALHWGMTLAVYPFWGLVSGQIGRLARLQGSIATAQIQRRLQEQLGERMTVSRRVRYLVSSFVDWGVLSETDMQGIYRPCRLRAIDDLRLVAWLVEALLHSRPDGTAPLDELLNHTILFPFQVQPVSAQHLVALCPRLEYLRHGLDADLVMLKKGDETTHW